MVIGRQLLLSVVLIASAAATSVLIYTDSESDLRVSPAADKNAITKSEPPDTTSEAITNAPGMDAFSEVVERPLFSRTRKPQPIVNGVASPEIALDKPVQKDQFLVMGIIITGEEKVVLLKPTGKSKDFFRAREGERVLEWTIESVTPEAVTIRQGDITDTLKLSDNVLSQAEKRRLAQQQARAASKDNRQAAQKRRVRTRSTRTPSTQAKKGTRPTTGRRQVPRPVKRSGPNVNPNGTAKKRVR